MSIFKLLSLTSNSEFLFSRLSQFVYRHLKLLFFRLGHTFDLVVVVVLSAMGSLFVALQLLAVDRPLVDRVVAGSSLTLAPLHLRGPAKSTPVNWNGRL